jgi:hypothetical protein
LDVQGRQTGPKSVILQRDWRAEHRHDPVAGELVHRAAIAPSTRCRTAEDVRHHLAQALRPYRRSDRQGTNHVGEQHSHLLELRLLSRFWGRRPAAVAKPGAVAQFSAARSAHRACQPHLTLPPLINGADHPIQQP